MVCLGHDSHKPNRKLITLLKIASIAVGVATVLLVLSVLGYRFYNPSLSQADKLAASDKSFHGNIEIHQGFVEFYAEDGHRLHHHEKNMTQGDIFQLASIAKLYTHAVAYALVDEGIINLDAPISELLPEEQWEGASTPMRAMISAT